MLNGNICMYADRDYCESSEWSEVKSCCRSPSWAWAQRWPSRLRSSAVRLGFMFKISTQQDSRQAICRELTKNINMIIVGQTGPVVPTLTLRSSCPCNGAAVIKGTAA